MIKENVNLDLESVELHDSCQEKINHNFFYDHIFFGQLQYIGGLYRRVPNAHNLCLDELTLVLPKELIAYILKRCDLDGLRFTLANAETLLRIANDFTNIYLDGINKREIHFSPFGEKINQIRKIKIL